MVRHPFSEEPENKQTSSKAQSRVQFFNIESSDLKVHLLYNLGDLGRGLFTVLELVSLVPVQFSWYSRT